MVWGLFLAARPGNARAAHAPEGLPGAVRTSANLLLPAVQWLTAVRGQRSRFGDCRSGNAGVSPALRAGNMRQKDSLTA